MKSFEMYEELESGFDERGREEGHHGRSESGPDDRDHRRGSHGHDRSHGHGHGRDRGFSEGRERLFDSGEFKLVLLKLLSENPSYGYQLIKTMEERMSGGYTPSAGVIYPTLTLLEDEGFAEAATENNKKVYSVTSEGTAYLQANKRQVTQLFERLEEASKGFERDRSPEIMKAFKNLRSAVAAHLYRENVTKKQIKKIIETIDAAAKEIDEF